MNIENHFYNAEANLEMANEKVTAQDYDSALAALAKAYSNIRELTKQVSALKALKDDVELPVWKDTG